MPLNANPQPLPPAKPIKPWLTRQEPIFRFRCDDGNVYCAQFHNLSATYVEASQTLEVNAHPHGTVVIHGPGVGELTEALCAGRATLIRSNGQEILSVTLVTEAEQESEEIVSAVSFQP